MKRRILIVGGGHNGLVCAAYLARAGRSVTLLERRSLFGGACVTEELWPGVRASPGAYTFQRDTRPIVGHSQVNERGRITDGDSERRTLGRVREDVVDQYINDCGEIRFDDRNSGVRRDVQRKRPSLIFRKYLPKSRKRKSDSTLSE